jgi:hypothetical protein
MSHRRAQIAFWQTGTVRSPDRFYVSSRGQSYVFTFFEGSLFMAIVIVAGTIGLIRFGVDVARPHQKPGSAESWEAAVVDRFEMLRIWFPKSLVELAESPCRCPVTRTHGEFQRYLERRHEENLWYAYTVRTHERNGKYADCTYLRHPYKDPFVFEELRTFLAGLAENPPHFETEELANVTFAVIPDDLLKHDESMAVRRLHDELRGFAGITALP